MSPRLRSRLRVHSASPRHLARLALAVARRRNCSPRIFSRRPPALCGCRPCHGHSHRTAPPPFGPLFSPPPIDALRCPALACRSPNPGVSPPHGSSRPRIRRPFPAFRMISPRNASVSISDALSSTAAPSPPACPTPPPRPRLLSACDSLVPLLSRACPRLPVCSCLVLFSPLVSIPTMAYVPCVMFPITCQPIRPRVPVINYALFLMSECPTVPTRPSVPSVSSTLSSDHTVHQPQSHLIAPSTSYPSPLSLSLSHRFPSHLRVSRHMPLSPSSPIGHRFIRTPA
ncbi:hypothetical protein BD413DRAFT_89686 [Trametes elegans]|nr:hypothetical protein BD413DRAFT_89686 [Trametes elegans]